MIKNNVIIPQFIYAIAMFCIITSAISATSVLDQDEGIILSTVFTKSSFSYLALTSFIVNAAMYIFEKQGRDAYLIIFGFSLIFLNPVVVQISGVIMMVLGLVFHFIRSLKKG